MNAKTATPKTVTVELLVEEMNVLLPDHTDTDLFDNGAGVRGIYPEVEGDNPEFEITANGLGTGRMVTFEELPGSVRFGLYIQWAS